MSDEVTVSADDLRLVLDQAAAQHRPTCRCVACQAWLRLDQRIVTPIPAEPPAGTILMGRGEDIWRHETDPDKWFCVSASRYYHTWKEAYAEGANPNRRLIEKSTVTNEQIDHIFNAMGKVDSEFDHHWFNLDETKHGAMYSKVREVINAW